MHPAPVDAVAEPDSEFKLPSAPLQAENMPAPTPATALGALSVHVDDDNHRLAAKQVREAVNRAGGILASGSGQRIETARAGAGTGAGAGDVSDEDRESNVGPVRWDDPSLPLKYVFAGGRLPDTATTDVLS